MKIGEYAEFAPSGCAFDPPFEFRGNSRSITLAAGDPCRKLKGSPPGSVVAPTSP
jgi:hypothetical protein